MKKDAIFDQYSTLFRAHGFHLYLVGGTARDLLLERPYNDWDLASEATPIEMKAFLPEGDLSFAKYGCLRLAKNIEITTFRSEGEYKDFRHPSYIHFEKDPKIDVKRRDFTINALYLNDKYEVLDYVGGLSDLDHHLIRFIGDPDQRVQEDPLRILRAYRFAKVLSFTIEPKTLEAIERGRPLLGKLNPEKVKEEEQKLEKAVQ